MLGLQLFTLRQKLILFTFNSCMEVYNNYKSYRKYLTEYDKWREEQELQYQKRKEFLKQNPDKISQDDIKRGKILLHAIDVMDEYSQSNAEDMEVATEMAVGQAVGLVTMLGTFGGLGLTMLPKVQKLISKYTQKKPALQVVFTMVPSLIGMLIGMAASFPAIVWATKAKVSSSRKGRFEAMRNDLKNPQTFAVLTEAQFKQAKDISNNIELEDKDKKRLEKIKEMRLNPLDSFKVLKKMYKNDSEYKQQKQEFDKKIKDSEKLFDSKLSDQQIKAAKRDQQLLSVLVQKMDIASQEYAENMELITNTLTSLSLAGGGLVGWISNKLLKVCKVNPANKFAKVIPWGVGLVIPLSMGIYSAKLQKQASRVARFNVKQEMLKDPSSLVYVEDSNAGEMTDVKPLKKQKKPNLFQFFKKIIKENKEYNKYVKEHGEQELKLNKAIEKLNLTDEQVQEAKALQMNVFKTFNKVDEMSQTYSESVEAMGEIVKQGVSVFGTLAATGITILNMVKTLKNPEKIKNISGAPFIKLMLKIMTPFAFVILPIIAIDVYTTKAQKKASRVADMLALKELEDYRHYADFSKKDTEEVKPPERIMPEESNLLKRIKA